MPLIFRADGLGYYDDHDGDNDCGDGRNPNFMGRP
jgi:hypothetical protein